MAKITTLPGSSAILTKFVEMIYLDNNATTPLDPQVFEAMKPYLTEVFGNAASIQHSVGRQVAGAVEDARTHVATLIDAAPEEIYFTSGATEAVNLVLKGIFSAYKRKGDHFVLPRTEHKAVLDTVKFLVTKGARVSFVDVDASGIIDLEQLESSIRDTTICVVAMWANNETGVIQDMGAIGEICSRCGTLLFSDAAQAVGRVPVTPRDHGVQYLSMSAHKMYGPTGAGALYMSARSPRAKLEPLIHGGGHERGIRAGTLNSAAIIGFGEACRVLSENLQGHETHLRTLQQRIEDILLEIDGAILQGLGVRRLPNTTSIRLPGIDARKLVQRLDSQVALATGSACTSANPGPSHVLQAMGLTREEANSVIRISAGRFNSMKDVEVAGQLIAGAVNSV